VCNDFVEGVPGKAKSFGNVIGSAERDRREWDIAADQLLGNAPNGSVTTCHGDEICGKVEYGRPQFVVGGLIVDRMSMPLQKLLQCRGVRLVVVSGSRMMYQCYAHEDCVF
jgi:hypothetical protein